MNVLMINGSPHQHGCTFTALTEVAGELEKSGIAATILHIGAHVRGCMACGKCQKTGTCVFEDDPVNEAIARLRRADGLVIGSPVHYASAAGALCSFMDRVFYKRGSEYRLKPGAAVVSCRRGGASAAFDRLNKYFTISQMPIVSSQYWNSVHGNTPDEVRQDLEGMQTMRILGRNMAWLIQCIHSAGDRIPMPVEEPKIGTNFIR